MPSIERNYYCICDDNCKFPTMTYEQIVEAIVEATGNVPEHVEDAFITKIKESNHNANLTFWKGTEAEFNALGVTAPVFQIGIDSNNKIYFIPWDIKHASSHSKGGNDELTPEDIGAEDRKLVFANTSVSASAFVSVGTYADFPYRASINLFNVDDTMIPEVVFNLADAISGNYAPIAQTYNGGVYIYATTVPDSAITIPTIICWSNNI